VAAGKPAPAGKVNVNTASVEQLTTLPGVGPALAARIVEHRQKAGSLKAPGELMNVKGIGHCRSAGYSQLQVGLRVGNAIKKLFRERPLARPIERHAISEDLARSPPVAPSGLRGACR
jgi:competence ComEA-like helix-hairpin-helix protein